MKDYFVYLNPHKIIDVLWQYSETLSDTLEQKFSETFRIGLILHVAGALERQLLHKKVAVDAKAQPTIKQSPYYDAIKTCNDMLAEQLQLQLDDNEIYYIEQLFDTQAQKQIS